MLKCSSPIAILVFFLTVSSIQAQNTNWTSSTALAVPAVYGLSNQDIAMNMEQDDDFLPYAEPILGITKEDYENHFEEYRVGSLLDRVLDLNHMELQAIYADSKMHEINVSFNSKITQNLVVNIYDQFGKKILSEFHDTMEGVNTYSVKTQNLPDGFYSMVVIGHQDQFIQRFIIE